VPCATLDGSRIDVAAPALPVPAAIAAPRDSMLPAASLCLFDAITVRSAGAARPGPAAAAAAAAAMLGPPITTVG
jgi:hypothetical protein